MTRKVMGPQGTEVCNSTMGGGGKRDQHNYELHDFSPKLNIIAVTKSRTMTRAVHVVRIGDEIYTGI
jgi:hypothetical protein